MTRRRVKRWGIGLVGTLALTGFGLVFANPVVLTGAAIPLTYVLYGTISRVPSADLAIERSFDTPDPRPGETVEVTLTVENTGETVLPDVRVVDGVPEELAVTDGSPRACVALTPGDVRTLTYTVVAKRGEYSFDDPVIRLRSLAATERTTADIVPDGDEILSSANTVRDAPLGTASLPRAGTLPTDSGGSGLEFYATRQYQQGDPMNRVDWRHYAKTGEFVTIQYRQEQAIRTVLVVDARPVGRVTRQPGYPTGAELCAYAGERLYGALERAGVVTSVTAVGLEPGGLDGLVGPDGMPWVDPETDRSQALQARSVFRGIQDLADDGAGAIETTPPSAMATDGGPDETTRRLLARLPPNAQVVVCTPLVDNWPVALAQALRVRDYQQVFVSPDVTGGESLGQQVTTLHRDLRLQALERVGATTVGWDLEQPIDYALRRSLPHLLTRQ
ncbi:MAG: putative repeat protein (TIGR01451 family) [Haloarculaceae archaeon]|jgi:uncharacterized repeat protein (TIGR01451 family)